MLSTTSTKGQSAAGGLAPGYWHVDPSTGIISLTDEALKKLINPDPIEKWYILDPDPIARGQWAVVYHCHHRVTGEEFAAKFSSRWRLGADCTADIEHEIAICAMLRPTFRAVRLVDVFSTDAEVVLVMEYAPGGDLQTLLDEDLVPYERNVIVFLRQLLEGLIFIHDRNIVHLDIKPQNLVLMGDFPDCSVKLCDFEISRMLTPGHEISQILGTADYVAPEIIHYEPITTKTDMWSFGVLTYVLLTGFLPFGGDTDQETFLEITKAELDFPEELFEDISEQAMDFIRRLLIRQPRFRMSARESLEHPWMKSELKIPKIPPQNLNLNFPIATNSPLSKSSSNTTKSPPLQKCHTSSTVPSTPTSAHNSILMGAMNEMELSSLRNNNSFEYKPSRSCLSPTGTPTIMTPINMTPNAMTPVSASPRETGLPPLYPYMSSKSSQSTHSSTCSLNRGGSRQSLERIRSMSKSREVLFERLQMSSQRKILSRSRERIFDGRYGLYKSREQLTNLQLISHSVETLPPFDFFANDDSLDNSLTNICTTILPLQSMISMVDEKNNNRHYKSMASINQISDHSYRLPNSLNRNHRHDSRFSINDEDYNSIVSQYESFNSVNNDSLSNSNKLRRQNSSDLAPGHASKKNEKNSQPSHQVSKKTKCNNTGECQNRCRREPIKSPSSPAVCQTEAPKRSPRKNSQEKVNAKDSKQNSGLKPQRENSSSRSRGSQRRKGSISHVEQRIQERHEKQARNKKIEKALKKETSKQKNNTQRSPKKETKKEPTPKRNRKVEPKRTPNKTKPKAPSSSSESSPCSSMESVKEVQRSKVSPAKQSSNADTDLGNCEKKEQTKSDQNNRKATNEAKMPLFNKHKADPSLLKSFNERKIEVDEAYVSLEEPFEDGLFSRSDSIESSTSVGSNCSTIRANDTETFEVIFNDAPNKGKETDKSDGSFLAEGIRRVKICESTQQEKLSTKQLVKKFESVVSKNDNLEPLLDPLSVIAEEEEESFATNFARSISTCSDVSSLVSEISEVLFNDELWKIQIRKGSETPPENNSARLRSYSIQGSSSTPIFPYKLSRSNSIHLDSPLTGKPRPWGELCSGSVGRACQLFSQKSNQFSFVGRKSSDPTSDRFPITKIKNGLQCELLKPCASS